MTQSPLVSIIMGSASDLHIMNQAKEFLNAMDIPCEMTVVSAHRTPERMFTFARTAKQRGIKTIIAGAGGAAHLPGMVASLTTLPVIGVPVNSSNSIEGIDSLLSMVQMPNGIPVATVAIGAGKNAGILAARILATSNEDLSLQLEEYEKMLAEKVTKQINNPEYNFSSSFDT
ncbi:TPA: 5-(carboxyamino)imidazole ribonucleotide mutase [Candidatus Peregrinibacteria bacterium]|nr:5-(carboxyamino)imidazole ribonucleotide mutase [Candidatus Peregrinibacteria bacterium]HIQ57096.1 5-(carboxyamino)imidazole ribonucleotide mutase [Candidatus Gracilibacteria bacterium]